MAVTTIPELLEVVEQIHGLEAVGLVNKAYETMLEAHKGQERIGGGPYSAHPEAVTLLLANEGYTDPVLLSGALLHDVVEDTGVTLEDIEEQFGEEIHNIVYAVTDYGEGDGNEHIPDKFARKIPTHEKILEMGEKDNRIWLIKITDRIHNLATKDAVSPARQKRMCDEAKKFHLVLAKKIGNTFFIAELEKLSA